MNGLDAQPGPTGIARRERSIRPMGFAISMGQRMGKNPAICSCNHPTLDPTPRPRQEVEAIRARGTLQCGRREVKQSSSHAPENPLADAVSALKQQAEDDAAYLSSEIAKLAKDGLPTKLSGVHELEHVISPQFGLTDRGETLPSQLTATAAAALRAHNLSGRALSTREIELRHREGAERGASTLSAHHGPLGASSFARFLSSPDDQTAVSRAGTTVGSVSQRHENRSEPPRLQQSPQLVHGQGQQQGQQHEDEEGGQHRPSAERDHLVDLLQPPPPALW